MQRFYDRFQDSQDAGPVVLTHIYLLVGCAAPLWLDRGLAPREAPGPGGASLPAYAGLLAVGVGDAFASVVGARFGRLRWPGTRKTVEGTAASALAQVAACCLLVSTNVRDLRLPYVGQSDPLPPSFVLC